MSEYMEVLLERFVNEKREDKTCFYKTESFKSVITVGTSFNEFIFMLKSELKDISKGVPCDQITKYQAECLLSLFTFNYEDFTHHYDESRQVFKDLYVNFLVKADFEILNNLLTSESPSRKSTRI